MANPRNELGLPKGNSGQMLTRARVTNMDGVMTRDALPLDGNAGGAPEWLFPDPMNQLEMHWTIPLGSAVVEGAGMEQFAREDVREVLARFEVTCASRATTTDSTEEVILLGKDDFASVDAQALTLALMDILPHTKVWVVEEHPRWSTEVI